MKIWSALALMLLYASYVTAHHAEAAFDHYKLASVPGTVKEFLWANPHALVYLEVTGPRHQIDVNVFECGSVQAMKRKGWSAVSLKPGDTVTIDYHPRRDKTPGGMLVAATLADGKKLTWQSSMP
jgi:Family of unknown function (DUF6152)